MIFVLGVDHWLQEYELWTRKEWILGEPSEEEIDYRKASKTTFYSLVENLIKARKYLVLGEECSPGQIPIPRRLAEENFLSYVEIDMTSDERNVAGIAPDYQSNMESEAEGFRLREDHMFAKIQASLEIGEDALIVCGANHVEGLKRRFEEHGFTVETKDVSKEKWAKNPILKWRQEGFEGEDREPTCGPDDDMIGRKTSNFAIDFDESGE